MAAGTPSDRENRRSARLVRSRSPRRGSGGRSGRALAFRLLKIVLGVTFLGGVLGLAGLVGLFAFYGSDPRLPSIKALGDYHPRQLTRVLDRNGAPIGDVGTERRTVVPFQAIPKTLVNAVVSAEDADFFRHGGLDYRGMLRAFIENVLRGRTAQGGSTITQQVVKTFLLSPERTMRRKVQEIILARQLDAKLSKQEILTLYLNQIYFGHGRYGCEEAARYYFGKSVRDIGLGEAALLAGLPQSPERLSPRKHPEAAKTRQRYVLGQMAAHGFIDRATAERLAAEPIRLARETGPSRELAPEVVDVAGRRLIERFGERDAQQMGGTIQTTIDLRLQQLARDSLERGLEDVDARQGYRGPSGRLSGKALEKRRAELRTKYPKGPRGPEIIEGIVARVERGPRAADAKDGKDAKDSKPAGRLVMDLGAVQGVVDLAQEPRYAKGSKPLAERFAPGDLVRVRAAPERRGDGELVPLALELGPQAAMVVLDPATHDVLALVGGYDFRPGSFDRSQRAHRQPGSAFKPVVYAAALDSRRFTPASIVNDAPDVYDRWKPQNYEKEEFRGPVRLRTALALSINTVAIKVLSEVGIPAARAMATQVGITSPMPEQLGLAMALGAMTVTPLELANAYATFASAGKRGVPTIVGALPGEKLTRAPLTPALTPEVAYLTTSLMRSVVEEGTARPAALKLRRPMAGKTGTSDHQRDAWFVGFTPDLLVAVWVGFDDMRSLGRGEAGGKTALPIWIDFMSKALAGRPSRDFVQPQGVVVQRIDKKTGLLAAPGQESETLDEVFLAGTAPTETAPAAGQELSADKLLFDGQ